MKAIIICFTWVAPLLTSCTGNNKANNKKNTPAMMTDNTSSTSGYSDVNGIKMYYEIYGQGAPLVLIPGGGSTISSSFGRIIPLLSKYYTVIAVELQNHGRSGFRDDPETFEQDADDVAALLHTININKASFFGFSNGGTTALQISIRHPEIVHKLVVAAASYKRDGFIPGFFDGMQQATLANMPGELKAAFLKVNPDTVKLQRMFEKDRDRMIGFKDLSDDQIRSITSPTLIINGDADVITPEHTLEMHRLLTNSQLAIIPGGHGKYIGEVTVPGNGSQNIDFTVWLIREFLAAP